MVSAWSLTLKNLLFPVFCRDCGRALMTEDNGYYCPECWALTERIRSPLCTICGKPHREQLNFGPVPNHPCADCRSARKQPYRRVYTACAYEGGVAEAIKLLKFHKRPQLLRPLAEELNAFIEAELPVHDYDAIVPVPLHPVRQRDRGFNQSELLAHAVVPAFEGSRLDTSLKRIRPTLTQSRLATPVERRSNVRGAFAVDRERNFTGETVLLVDDVVTSGGTVAECARALDRAGATTIDVLAIAQPITEWEFSDRSERRREEAQQTSTSSVWWGG